MATPRRAPLCVSGLAALLLAALAWGMGPVPLEGLHAAPPLSTARRLRPNTPLAGALGTSSRADHRRHDAPPAAATTSAPTVTQAAEASPYAWLPITAGGVGLGLLARRLCRAPSVAAAAAQPSEEDDSLPLFQRSVNGADVEVYQVRVSLKGAPDPIWRRLLVPAHMELKDFHQVLQISMPWGDLRLHQFVTEEEAICYLPPPTRKRWVGPTDQLYVGVRLNQVLRSEADSISYEYDFLHHWCHDVVLEKILVAAPGEMALPRCTAGERACPPEGSGNPLGDPADATCWALAATLSFDPEQLDKFLMLWGHDHPALPLP